jgi:hypothetical protein
MSKRRQRMFGLARSASKKRPAEIAADLKNLNSARSNPATNYQPATNKPPKARCAKTRQTSKRTAMSGAKGTVEFDPKVPDTLSDN